MDITTLFKSVGGGVEDAVVCAKADCKNAPTKRRAISGNNGMRASAGAFIKCALETAIS
jgi:hypothetical protein